MAYADYLHCAVCDRKAIYDANMDYEAAETYNMLGDIAVLCGDCVQSHRLNIEIIPTQRKVADFLEPVEYNKKSTEAEE